MRTDGRTDWQGKSRMFATFLFKRGKIEDKPHSLRQLEDADSCLSSPVAPTPRPTGYDRKRQTAGVRQNNDTIIGLRTIQENIELSVLLFFFFFFLLLL
jgi:hypothetical protein